MSDPVADTAPAEAAVAPGNPLAAARHAAGLSIADVGRQLKLSGWQIEALEAGDYARLPGPVFVRGFLRNYARLLKIDPEPLLAEIAGHTPVVAPVVPEPAPSANIPFPGQRIFRWRPFAIAGLITVAALAAYELFDGDPAATDSDTRTVELPQPKVVAEVVPTEPVPLVAAVPSPTAAPATAPASSASVAVAPQHTAPAPQDKAAVETRPAPVAKPAPDVTPAPAAKAPAEQRPVRIEPAADERVVRFMFTRDSWVEVRDRQGRTIFSQLNAAGTTQAISGQPPLRLVVGNAAGVRMLYNDKPVDLAPHTQVDVARLTLE